MSTWLIRISRSAALEDHRRHAVLVHDERVARRQALRGEVHRQRHRIAAGRRAGVDRARATSCSSGAPVTSAPISANFLPMRTDIVRVSLESLRA